jgi:hypothetical protein
VHNARPALRRKMIMLLPKARPKSVECSTRGASMLRDGVDKSMTTSQSIALGMMIVWTPSVLLLAIFLWSAPVTSDAPVISKKAGHLSDQELCGSQNLDAEDTTIQPLEAEDNAKKKPEPRSTT